MDTTHRGRMGAAYGNIVLNVQQSAEFAPLVLSQPQSQAVATGGSVTFAVTAAGAPAPVYQWLLNGVALAGKTNATLQLNNVATNQAGAYSVLLSNAAGMRPAPRPRSGWKKPSTRASSAIGLDSKPAKPWTWPWPMAWPTWRPARDSWCWTLATLPTRGRIGGYNTDSPATRIAAQDGFVYLLTSSNQLSGATLSRFDARNPGLPKKVAEYVSSAASDFALADNLLCAVDGQSLLVLNTNCALLARLDTANGIASGVVVSNAYAYVTWPNFIGVYSLANPATPTPVATLTQSSAELALASGYLYALTGGQQVVQLRVLDPGNPQRPQVGFSSRVERAGTRGPAGAGGRLKRRLCRHSGLSTAMPWASIPPGPAVESNAPGHEFVRRWHAAPSRGGWQLRLCCQRRRRPEDFRRVGPGASGAGGPVLHRRRRPMRWCSRGTMPT